MAGYTPNKAVEMTSSLTTETPNTAAETAMSNSSILLDNTITDAEETDEDDETMQTPLGAVGDDVSSMPSFDPDDSSNSTEDNRLLRQENECLRAELSKLRTQLFQERKRGRQNPNRDRRLLSESGFQALRRGKSHSSGPDIELPEEFEPGFPIEIHRSAGGLCHRHPATHTTCTTHTHPSSKVKQSHTKEEEAILETHGLLENVQLSSSDEAEDNVETNNKNREAPALDLEAPAVETTPSSPNIKTTVEKKDEEEEGSTSFCEAVFDRAGWLVGLLVLQSLSSFIIKRNEALLTQHAVIVQFLTMLVGAGGNAGNQATVKVIRGIALGDIHEDNVWDYLKGEFRFGLTLSAILGAAGCLRAAVFMVPLVETIAITISLFSIVWISTILGCFLPLGMQQIGIDPAHSSTTIQVLMDILGVTITVQVCSMILGSTGVSNGDGEMLL